MVKTALHSEVFQKLFSTKREYGSFVTLKYFISSIQHPLGTSGPFTHENSKVCISEFSFPGVLKCRTFCPRAT